MSVAFTVTLRRSLAALLLGLAGAAQAQAPSVTPLDGKALRTQAERLAWWGDYAALERLLVEAAADPRESVDGDSALALVNHGPRYLGNTNGEHRAYLEAVLRDARAWRAQNPGSGLALRLEARALSNLAWFDRGGGYASTVSEEGFKAFKARIDEARQLLLSQTAVLERSSQPYYALLWVGQASGWPPATTLKVLETALQREPRDPGLFVTAMPSMTPRWNGAANAVEALVRMAMKHSPGREAETYARLYLEAAQAHYEQTLFTASRARWPEMRDGLRQMVQRLPASAWARNQLAMVACLAKDRAVYQEALESLAAMGRETEAEHWQALGGQRMIDGCQRWGAGS